MKISSFLLVLFLLFILIFSACLKKPDGPVAVSDDLFPSTPQNVEVTIGDRKIAISWRMPDSSNIEKYYIYRKDSTKQLYLLIDSSYVNTYTDKFLDNSLYYFYQVSAINLNGYQGPCSEPIGASPGVYNVIINNGANYTDSLSVILTFVAPSNMSLLKISNDSLFQNAAWEPYVDYKNWKLDEGDGTKKVYAKFQDESGTETSITATDSIILDTKAFINLVTENTAGEIKTIEDTIHFTIVSDEINGIATIDIGEAVKGITLRDDGSNGDVIPDDGCYEIDYIINKDFTAINSLVVGNFIDRVGNVAVPAIASGRINIQQFPTPVLLFDPIIDGTTLYLSWTQNNDIEFSSYRVYRSKSPGVNSNQSAIAVISERTINYYRDEGLENSTSYYYCVYVYTKSGLSVESNEVEITTDANRVPEKVILAVPLLMEDTTLRLSWTQSNEDDFASYRIFRSESSPVDTNAAPVMIINEQTTTLFDDENLARNTEYFYRIFVYDVGGLRAGSDEVSGRTAP